MPDIFAVIPAAGSGTRMGDSLPKQYIAINGQPMIFHTLAAFAAVARIRRIVVVLAPDDRHWQPLLAQWQATGANQALAEKLVTIREGGATRAISVCNGLQSLQSLARQDDWALVHDAARPCISPLLIEQFLDELEHEPVGGLLALPVADTLKRGNSDLRVEATVPRTDLWRAQTPQMFRYGLLCDALARMPQATDEAEAVEALGHQPRLVTGDSANLKVTYATDLKIAEILLGSSANSNA
jgi:2-C-methyl-D-erythritol 4-phosphate cytidylyltransferase